MADGHEERPAVALNIFLLIEDIELCKTEEKDNQMT